MMDMFEKARLLGGGQESIELQTRIGRSIENFIEVEPGEREHRLWRRQEEAHPHWVRRKPPCGVYNCAGLVWASRRTAIFEEIDWEDILCDDGYRKLASSEPPQIGDLVIYNGLDPKIGYIHVGIVLALEQGFMQNAKKIPRVLSKFNSASGEYIHWEHDHPFKDLSFDIEYWTDRAAT